MAKRKFYAASEHLTLQGNPLLADHTVADIRADKLTTLKERSQAATMAKAVRKEKAEQLLGAFSTGEDTYILSRGQFSLIELIETVLQRTGPADVYISTWTAAHAEIDDAFEFLNNGMVTSCHWLFDISFKSRNPAFWTRVIDLFGADAVRQCWNHAKMAMIENDSYKVTILTSANLNKNPRLEYYLIRENAAFFDFNRQWFMELFE